VVDRPGAGSGLVRLSRWPDLGPAARPFRTVAVPLIGIASSDLRRRVAEGRSIRYQVPRGVEAYIEAQRLYRATPEDSPVP
jgi:nicotinate-nucleotide adenylyltransferase